MIKVNAIIFLLIGMAFSQVTPAAYGLTPTPSPTPTVEIEGWQVVWPMLQTLQPASAQRGETVTVTGSGGYLTDGQGGYNESSRNFNLFFDGIPVGSINCYVNYCQGTVNVPFFASAGEHVLSVEGGSSLPLTVILEGTPTPSTPTPTPAATEVYRPWADLTVTLSNSHPQLGEQITAEVTLNQNGGCDYATYDMALTMTEEGVFRSDSPAKIGPPVSYPAVFTLTTISTGTTTLKAQAYGEYHCNGAWTWGYLHGESAAVTIQQPPATLDVAIPVSGGAVQLGEHDMVVFGANSFTDTVIFRSTPYLTPGELSSFYELSAINSKGQEVQPLKPYTLSLHYSIIPPDVHPDELKLYYRQDGQWFIEPTSRGGMAAQEVIANPTHFSLWGVMVGSSSEGARRIYLPLLLK